MVGKIEELVLDEVMASMGYIRHASNGFVRYRDPETPDADPLVFDLRQGPLLVGDVEHHLDYHGVNLEVFNAALEATGPPLRSRQ